MNATLEKPLTTNPKIPDLPTKTEIISRLALNEPCRTIANDYNVTRSAIQKLKDQNREEVEHAKEQIVQINLKRITDTIEKDINVNYTLSGEFSQSTDNITTEKVAFKALVQKTIINPLLQKIGIFPSHAFANINIDNSKHINADPKILAVFSNEFAKSFTPMPMMEANGDDDADN